MTLRTNPFPLSDITQEEVIAQLSTIRPGDIVTFFNDGNYFNQGTIESIQVDADGFKISFASFKTLQAAPLNWQKVQNPEPVHIIFNDVFWYENKGLNFMNTLPVGIEIISFQPRVVTKEDHEFDYLGTLDYYHNDDDVFGDQS